MDERVGCEQDEQTSEWMSLAIDGLLDVDRLRQLEMHLATCGTCRVEWEAMQGIADLFARSPMVSPAPGFAVRVERRLVERVKVRRRLLGGIAVLTSSLSLAGAAAAMVGLVVLGVVLWHWLGSFPAVQQGSGVVSQVASGVGLVGKGASLLLKDVLLRYGLPLVLPLGIGVAALAAVWGWLLHRRRADSHRNGYA